MGYILFGLGTLTLSGVVGATLHVIYHAIVKALLFCCVGWIIKAVGQRNIQNGDKSGWFRGKSLDTFGPVGPQVVPADAIGDAQNLDIRCRLNGRVV